MLIWSCTGFIRPSGDKRQTVKALLRIIIEIIKMQISKDLEYSEILDSEK